jgi:DNA invertase Pin-like site-specific DNA recombinase
MDPTTVAKRYVAYERVSTDEQAASGAGLAAQTHALTRAFEYEGWELVERVRDEGESASTMDRPGLRRALELVATREADGIVVAKLDRLTRSVVDFGELLEWLKEADAALVALDLQLDTASPTGALVAQIIVAVAEWERRAIAERTRLALAAKRAAGQPIGMPSVGDSPELAALIRGLADSGHSLREIARRLTADGVPTVRGGTEWRPSSVQVALGYQRPAARRKRSALPKIRRRPRAIAA